MSAGVGMEVGQQEAAFASNTMTRTAQGVIDLIKEATREKKRSVTVEAKEEKHVAEEEPDPPKETDGSKRQQEFNGLALAKLYEQTGSRKLFLEKLLQLDEVKKNPRVMDHIRHILKTIRQYALYYHVAQAKGILQQIMPGGRDGSIRIPDRWEETPEFGLQMQKLWKLMDIDMDAYLTPESRRAYDELAETLKEMGTTEELLAHLSMEDGEYVLTKDTGEINEEGEPVTKEKRFVVLTPERYAAYEAYVQEKQKAREESLPETMIAAVLEEPLLVFKEVKETGDIIVDANNRELQAFLKKEREEKAKTMITEIPIAEVRSVWLKDFISRTSEALRQELEQKKEQEQQRQQSGQQEKKQTSPAPAPIISDPSILLAGRGIGR